jgi:hypothetical protein
MNNAPLRALALTMLATALATGQATPARAAYTFTTFDGPNNTVVSTTANGINNNGAVVGVGTDANGNNFNFIRNPNGTFTNLNVNGSTAAMANGINVLNQVVGNNGNDAFLITSGNTTVLPVVNPGNTASQIAFGINDAGTIVGQYVDNTLGTTPGFVYQNSKFTVLTPVANAMVTNAQGINNNGLVLGFYSTTDTPVIDGNPPQHGFFYDTKTNTFIFPKDPVQPNFFLVQFLGINDRNQAAGYWQDTAGNQHGLIYDINTGVYTFMDDPNAAPFEGKEITQITGINNSGEITGFFIDANGVQHGFIANVPEPSSTALVGIGLACTLGYFRRRAMKVV